MLDIQVSAIRLTGVLKTFRQSNFRLFFLRMINNVLSNTPSQLDLLPRTAKPTIVQSTSNLSRVPKLRPQINHAFLTAKNPTNSMPDMIQVPQLRQPISNQSRIFLVPSSSMHQRSLPVASFRAESH